MTRYQFGGAIRSDDTRKVNDHTLPSVLLEADEWVPVTCLCGEVTVRVKIDRWGGFALIDYVSLTTPAPPQ